MNTFEITVQRKAGDGWPVVVEQGRPGEFLPIRGEGVLRLDPVELRGQATPRDYGTVLGRALFRDAVARAFDRARAESDDRLRVLLFVEDPGLKALHWERLCAPLDLGDTWDFLARDQRAPFSLYLPSLTDRRFRAIGRRDLRALVVVASPDGLGSYGLAPFDAGKAVSGVRMALGRIPCDVLATVEGAVGPPTLDALCARITAERYTLLHVACHGQLAGGETVLYLAKADGQVDPVAGTRLLERLRGLGGARGLPHFAFLATCESASLKAEGALGGLAQRLVRELGMPAVLAMTEAVSVETAQALAAGFYRYLREHGEPDRALVEACAGLAERGDVTVPALYGRLGGRPLFSDALDRELTDTEIAYGLGRVRDLLAERAPVLREPLDARAATLRQTLGRDGSALSEAAGDEREEALADVNQLCEEALELSFHALALGQEPPAYDARCPFRGLYPFRVEDREFFFGREALVEGLRQKPAEHHFLAVLGPSGSGKSSLVLAGLIPALQAGEPSLQTAYLTPGAAPLAQLEAALASLDDRPFIVAVDQLEELFTLCPDEAERRSFLGRLLELAGRTPVVVTMRADFWGECAPYRELKELMQARQELIPPMDAVELRRAMELQAEKVGLRFEADLANTILDDVRGEPGAMPLLQHALLELWKRRHGRWLQAAEYRAIGGVQRAIARTADDLYEALPPDERERVRDIFMRLTRLNEEAVPGEERRDTRRRVWLDELVPAGSDPAATIALVKRLADARLVVTGVDDASGREEAEVAHEALIRHWPRLRGWLDEDRAGLRVHRRLTEAAQEWQQRGRDEGVLYRGARLSEAVEWRERHEGALNDLERGFLDASVALRERDVEAAKERHRRELEAAQALARSERRARVRQRYLTLGLAGLLLAALAAMVFARQQRDEALAQERMSRSRELAPVAISHLSVDPELGVLLATEAAGIADTDQARDALRRSVLQSRVRAAMRGHTDTVRSAQFSPDGTRVLTASGEAEQSRTDTTARVWDASTGNVVAVLGGHAGPVWSAQFGPDGRMVVTAGVDGTARLWEADTGRSLAELRGHDGPIWSARFSPDGQRVVTASADNTGRVWEAGTGSVVAELRGHAGPVTSAEFSPDGTFVVTASEDDAARVWEAGTGRGVAEMRGHRGTVTDARFGPDGRWVVTASRDGIGRVWETATGRSVAELRGHAGPVTSAQFSPDGTFVVAASEDNTARVWEAGTGRGVAELRGHTREVFSAEFSPDGKAVVTASGDGAARVWDLVTGGSVAELRGHTSSLTGARFSRDGKLVVTGSEDKTARVWDVSAPGGVAELRGHTEAVRSAEFSHDGARLLTAGDTMARLWDASTGRVFQEFRGHMERVHSARFSPDERRVVTASEDTTARVWEASTGRSVAELRGHTDIVYGARFSPDGRWVITASKDRTARIWEADTGSSVRELPRQEGEVRSAQFSPDGRILATAGKDTAVRLWDVGTGNVVAELRGHGDRVFDAQFSPDGHRIVTASEDRTARVWDASTGRTLVELTGHADAVRSAHFSPDGRWVVTGGDTTARVWEASTGRSLAVLRGHARELRTVAFGPDGRFVVTGSEDGTAHVSPWEMFAPFEEVVALAGTRVTRALTAEERRQYLHESPGR